MSSSWADNHLTAHEQTLWVWHPFLFILLRLDQDELEAVAGQVPLLPALTYAILSADLICRAFRVKIHDEM
jgi:hypothetical protein